MKRFLSYLIYCAGFATGLFLVKLAFGQPLMNDRGLFIPGNPANPIIIKQDPLGRTIIHEKTPIGRNPFDAGTPFNPYVIERNVLGEIEIKSQFPTQERRW